jgi:hypothetical protein
MLSDHEVIDRLWAYGHFNNPAFPNTLNITQVDLPRLKITDPEVVQAVASAQSFMAGTLDELTLKHYMRPSIADGDVGYATRELLMIERCGHPDYGYLDDNGNIVRTSVPAHMAQGVGNWRGCYGVGAFHAVRIRVNDSNLPAFLRPHWPEVQRRVAAAYAEVGLRIIWDNSQPGDIEVSFVRSSTGWIGLAILGGNGRGCGTSPIWAKFLADYKGGNSAESIITQWTTLVKHELGHNCGLEHTRGGVMNSSIVNGLQISWKGDPHWQTLVRKFGGVPLPGGTPGPGPGPLPPIGTPVPRLTTDGHIDIIVPENCKPGIHRFRLVPEIVV